MSINSMQRRFILEYLGDGSRNAAAAARRAGYSDDSAKQRGHVLLRNEEIQRAMEHELQRHLEHLQIDAEMVLQGILDTIKKAERSGEGAWQSATILKGWELLGRYLGMFKEQIAVGVDEAIMKQLELGRARAAGLLKEPEPIIAEDADSNAVEVSEDDTPKPN
jgi:phage terminase small subunit